MNSKTESDSNSYSESISPFTAPSKPASKIEKIKENRNRQRQTKNMKSPQTGFSAELLEIDINNEIKEAERAIDEIYQLLPPPKYQTEKVDIEDLRAMEESIRRKNISIKNIEEEIKQLKSGIFYDSKKQGDNYPKLSNQIKSNKEVLIRCKNELIAKKKEAQEKQNAIRAIEQQFKQKCKQERIECITFQQFRQIELKKKKEGKKVQKLKKVVSAKKFSYHPQISSMKEIPERESRADLKAEIKNPQNHVVNDSKKMKDLLQKKNVAEAALKNAKKRHALEINDLQGKLEFLRDEYQDLEQKLAVKEHELRLAQNKFSESRSSSEKRFSHRKYKTDRNI